MLFIFACSLVFMVFSAIFWSWTARYLPATISLTLISTVFLYLIYLFTLRTVVRFDVPRSQLVTGRFEQTQPRGEARRGEARGAGRPPGGGTGRAAAAHYRRPHSPPPERHRHPLRAGYQQLRDGGTKRSRSPSPTRDGSPPSGRAAGALDRALAAVRAGATAKERGGSPIGSGSDSDR